MFRVVDQPSLYRFVALITVVSILVARVLTFALVPEPTHLPSLLIPFVIALPCSYLVRCGLLNAHKLTERLRYIVEHDVLTGVKSRRYFFDQAPLLLEAEGCLVMVDIDHFKQINDSYGHHVGDCVLKEVAGTLARFCEPPGIVARLGGEEFVIFLPQTDLADGIEAAEHMREVIARAPVQIGPHSVQCTVSMGLSALTARGDFDEFLRLADQALYDAKRNGRNRLQSHRKNENVAS